MTDRKHIVGKVLIAEPFLADPNFKRSVVLICDHHPVEGSVGFILNKPLDMRVDELVADFPEFDSVVYFGGPVQTDTIHYIHNAGKLLEGSTLVAPGVYWGGDFQKLKSLIDQQVIHPGNIRFFVGYSGWTEGQLEMEMNDTSWVIAPMESSYAFRTDPGELWQKTLIKKGDVYTVIAQMPDAATMN